MKKWATVLAVGWYLLTPPIEKNAKGEWEAKLYYWLAKWDHVASYDTAKECESGHEKYITTLGNSKGLDNKYVMAQYIAALTESKCVASDDPNLRRPA